MNYIKPVWLTSVFYRWGWGAPFGGLVHAHPRETPASAQRSRAGLHVSALQWCLQKCSVVLFSVMNAANVSTLQGQAAESGREASRCGVWAEVSAQQTWCVVASLLWTCCYTHAFYLRTPHIIEKMNILIMSFLILSQRKTGLRRTKVGSRSSWLSWLPSLNSGTKL